MEENQEKKVINLSPLKKGKRVLLFLADYFINFILGFLLFVVMVYPLGKVMTGFNAKRDVYNVNLELRGRILIGNKIIHDSHDVDIFNISYNVDFTSDCFLSYYAFDEESPSNMRYNQFGHKEDNKVFHTYFINILGNEEKFITLFDKYNEKFAYFERSGTSLTLKAEIRNQVRPNFIKGEECSQVGKEYVSNIKSSIYLPMFSEIMESIKTSDLLFEGHSYNQTQTAIIGYEKYTLNLITATALIAVFLSTSILYLVIPLCNKGRKTIGMFIMNIEVVNIRSLGYLKKKEQALRFVYSLFHVFLISFFVPMTSIPFVEMFRIQLLFIIMLFSLTFMLINLISLLFDQYNRSLFDRLLGVVHLKTADLDEVYRAKGYYL